MSLAATVARVQALQGLIAAPPLPPSAAPSAPSSAFAAQLAGASASGAAAKSASSVPFAGAPGALPAPGVAGAPGTAPAAGVAAGAPAAPAGAVTSLPAGTPFATEIEAAAKRHDVDPALLAGLVKQESNFNPRAVSSAGAKGLTQLMPGTATGLGVSDPFDPAQALEGGAKYLRQMLDQFGGDTARALAAYNAGPGAVSRFGGVPPYAETQEYVRRVQANAVTYRGSAPAASTTPALAAPIIT